MDLLARRIEIEGPLPAREAVRLVSRLARTVEAMHAKRAVHGRLGATAVGLSGPRMAQAKLLPSSMCPDEDIFWSPERRAGAGSSAADDTYAIALLLYFALTGWTQPGAAEVASPQNQRPPPLAVFDAGDDALEQILLGALAVEPAARPRTLAAFRAELDSWLEAEGAAVDDALPLAEPSRPGDAPSVDVASLPPPPSDAAAQASPNQEKGELFAVLDEESTWKKAEAQRPRSVRPPKLVPPKAARSKAPPPLPSASDVPPLPDEDEGRPTLPRTEPQAATAPAEASAIAEAPPSDRDGSLEPRPVEPPRDRAKASAIRWPLVVGGTATVVVLGYVLTRGGTEPSVSDAPAARSAAPAVSTSPAPSAAPSVPAPAASAAPAPEPTASATTSGTTGPADSAKPPPNVVDTAACLRELFPPDTFTDGASSLTFVCEEASPVRGAPQVREALVRDGKGKVTDGMKEWAVLGYFELGAYAVMRGRCCSADVAPLDLPISPGKCPPLAEPLGAVAQASRPGTDDRAAKNAIDELDRAIRCITRSKQTKPFGKYPRLSGGEGSTLAKTMKRARGN